MPLIEENEDKTKKYKITADDGVDLRKNIFDTFAKEEITIFEMKKSDVTLEDAFMQLINSQDGNAVEQEKEQQLADETDETEENKTEDNETEENEVEENKEEKKDEGGQE